MLLVESDERIRRASAKKLLSLGYRVSALADGDQIPLRLPCRLYDVIIIGVGDAALVSFRFCEDASPDVWPAVVVLTNAPFALDAPALPAVVICDELQSARERKLLAFLGLLTGISTPAETYRAWDRMIA